MEADTHDYYFCIKDDGAGHHVYKIDTDLSTIRAWADNAKPEASSADGASKNVKNDSIKELDALPSIISRIGITSEQQHELISLTNFVGASFPSIIVERDLVSKLLENRSVVHASTDYKILAVTQNDIPGITKELNRALTMSHGLEQLPGAILLSLVATFDSQMSDVVRTMLRIKSDKLKYGQKTIPLSKIFAATSLDDLVSDAVNDEIYQFSRGSHDDQVNYIEEHFSISIKAHWKRWPDLIEVFERRNLVAHGERNFTSRYQEICTKVGHKGAADNFGKSIKVSSNYLRQASDLLAEFSALTTFSLWRKHMKGEEADAFSSLLELAFNAIGSPRASLAERICSYALSLKSNGLKEAMKLRFVVNLASAYMHLSQDKKGLDVLSEVDWSATSDDFRICVAALRKDVDEVCNLLPIIKATNKLAPSELRTWPVFDYVKDDGRFIASFQEAFGEEFVVNDFTRSADISTRSEDGEPSDSLEVTSGKVVH
jgi:hypothetical protein